MKICPHCGKSYSSKGIGTHIWRTHTKAGQEFDPNKNYASGSRTAWNKGLSKESDDRVNKHSEKLKKKFADGFKIEKTLEGRKKLSEGAKERKLGGYRPHPNRGVYYNGIYLDSKWEERVAIELDSNNIEWTRPKTGFIWNTKGNKYYPDFYLPEYDVYLDPKNDYLIKKDHEKITNAMKMNNITVIVLNENQLSWKAIHALLV